LLQGVKTLMVDLVAHLVESLMLARVGPSHLFGMLSLHASSWWRTCVIGNKGVEKMLFD